MANIHDQNKTGPVYVYGHRRIMRGRTSYSVTIPREWLTAVGLKAGDQVLLTSKGRDLIISPAGRMVDVNENTGTDAQEEGERQ